MGSTFTDTSLLGAGPSAVDLPRATARRPRTDTTSFHLALRDRQLLVLFEVAAAERDVRLTSRPGDADWTVTDAVPIDADGRNIILVLPEASPLACRTAVELVEQGAIRAVLTPDRAALMDEVARLAAAGQASLPTEVVSAAAEAPEITRRQREVLRLVARGSSNHQAANHLHVSATTVKRDVSELLRAFGCRNRLQLRAAALDLGILG